jgi:hypothetical protein
VFASELLEIRDRSTGSFHHEKNPPREIGGRIETKPRWRHTTLSTEAESPSRYGRAAADHHPGRRRRIENEGEQGIPSIQPDQPHFRWLNLPGPSPSEDQ